MAAVNANTHVAMWCGKKESFLSKIIPRNLTSWTLELGYRIEEVVGRDAVYEDGSNVNRRFLN